MEKAHSQELEAKHLGQTEELEELESIPELESADEERADTAQVKKEEPPQKSRRLPTLLRLTRRAVVFLTLTLIATIIFFVTGNKQTFLDSNLRMILKIIAANAIALSFFSLVAIPECIFFSIKDKKFRLMFHLVCYVLILALSAAVSVLSLTVHLLSEGVNF